MHVGEPSILGMRLAMWMLQCTSKQMASMLCRLREQNATLCLEVAIERRPAAAQSRIGSLLNEQCRSQLLVRC